jgi:hypothetical protein
MSKNIIVTWKRAGATLSTKPFPLRLDNMSWRVATDMGGASPYDSYWAYTSVAGMVLPGLHRGDLFTDITEIDPDTKALTAYRIFGNPETMDASGMEIAVEKVVGT